VTAEIETAIGAGTTAGRGELEVQHGSAAKAAFFRLERFCPTLSETNPALRTCSRALFGPVIFMPRRCWRFISYGAGIVPIAVRIVFANLKDLRNKPVPGPPLDMNEDVDGIADVGFDGVDGPGESSAILAHFACPHDSHLWD
jgi:hypothetical protein